MARPAGALVACACLLALATMGVSAQPYLSCPISASQIQRCSQPDSFYESARCATPKLYDHMEFSESCEAVWNFIAQVSTCFLWSMTSQMTREVMKQGCIMDNGDFVTSSITMKKMLNEIENVCRSTGVMYSLANEEPGFFDNYAHSRCHGVRSLAGDGGSSNDKDKDKDKDKDGLSRLTNRLTVIENKRVERLASRAIPEEQKVREAKERHEIMHKLQMSPSEELSILGEVSERPVCDRYGCKSNCGGCSMVFNNNRYCCNRLCVYQHSIYRMLCCIYELKQYTCGCTVNNILNNRIC